MRRTRRFGESNKKEIRYSTLLVYVYFSLFALSLSSDNSFWVDILASIFILFSIFRLLFGVFSISVSPNVVLLLLRWP